MVISTRLLGLATANGEETFEEAHCLQERVSVVSKEREESLNVEVQRERAESAETGALKVEQ